MKCPICGKELEIRNKQIGTNENGEPVFNEYAICRDCRKQWNLDKQRAKRAAAKHSDAMEKAKAAPEKKTAAEKKEAEPVKAEKTVSAPEPKEETASIKKKPVKKHSEKPAHPEEAGQEEEKRNGKKPVHKKAGAPRRRHPESDDVNHSEDVKPAKKPVKKRPVKRTEEEDEQHYGNIPPEKVRSKREKAARKSYEDMLATGEMKKASPAKPDKKKKKDTVKTKVPEPEKDEYDDDEYYDDEPRFRPMRIILGIISILGFGYFIYRGFVTGLSVTSDGGGISSGTTFIVLALCMLVSALLYFIMLNRITIFAFLLPMIFYLGSAVFAFLQRGDDLQLLLAAIICAVLAVISLILAVTSRGGDYEEEEDYDDPFEDDYADDDYDD